MARRHILKDIIERGLDPKKPHSRVDAEGRIISGPIKVDSPVVQADLPVEVAVEPEPVPAEPEPVVTPEPAPEPEVVEESEVVAEEEEPEVELVRAREEDGQFKADDPSTPDVNEAWVEEPVEEGNPAEEFIEGTVKVVSTRVAASEDVELLQSALAVAKRKGVKVALSERLEELGAGEAQE